MIFTMTVFSGFVHWHLYALSKTFTVSHVHWQPLWANHMCCQYVHWQPLCRQYGLTIVCTVSYVHWQLPALISVYTVKRIHCLVHLTWLRLSLISKSNFPHRRIYQVLIFRWIGVSYLHSSMIKQCEISNILLVLLSFPVRVRSLKNNKKSFLIFLTMCYT